MNLLDQLLPAPRLLQIDTVDLKAPSAAVWELVRNGDLGRSGLSRALFSLRTWPRRLAGREVEAPQLRLDALRSSEAHPGFQRLLEDAPHAIALGAIGKVWKPDIDFVHVDGAEAFRAFTAPDYVKVAWSLALVSLDAQSTRLTIEVRVDATDERAWRKFRAYFRVVGPASHFIRRSLLHSLERELGPAEVRMNDRPLPGDAFLPDALDQITQHVTLRASPQAIWPWLVQMGSRRAGFYSYDLLDNDNLRSAREIHPELQALRTGDVMPATPDGGDGFEVLAIDEARALVLGGLYDPLGEKQLPFAATRPDPYWQVTWSFVLEPLGAELTRLWVRARAACPPGKHLHLTWIRFVHRFMEREQLAQLKARVEGHLSRDDLRDVLEGLSGSARILMALCTPFLNARRAHWGLSEADAQRSLNGDALVPTPDAGWTHAVELDASAHEVWPWLAQIGADKAGFYSYQWLENLAGCELRNAESVHPEWEVREGDVLSLHPDIPGLPVVELKRGAYFVAYAAAKDEDKAQGKPWVTASWLFFVEPLGAHRCRVISRYRVACSHDLATRLAYGPLLLQPIGFAMDRRMLLGIKQRVERAQRAVRFGATGAVREHDAHRQVVPKPASLDEN